MKVYTLTTAVSDTNTLVLERTDGIVFQPVHNGTGKSHMGILMGHFRPSFATETGVALREHFVRAVGAKPDVVYPHIKVDKLSDEAAYHRVIHLIDPTQYETDTTDSICVFVKSTPPEVTVRAASSTGMVSSGWHYESPVASTNNERISQNLLFVLNKEQATAFTMRHSTTGELVKVSVVYSDRGLEYVMNPYEYTPRADVKTDDRSKTAKRKSHKKTRMGSMGHLLRAAMSQ